MYKKLNEKELSAILETGIDEFAKNGLDRANINVIAKKAGVSVGVIYKYFGDKDGFFLECVRHSLRLLDRVLMDAVSAEADVMTSIQNLIEALIRHAREHSNYNAMYNEITSGSCRQYAALLATEIESPTARAYSALFEKARAEGVVDAALDPALFAFFFDNLLMTLQFSYSCEYYEKRMKLFCGEDIMAEPERMTREFMRFMRSALKA